MKFYHTKCGGEIDVKKRRCTRCKKKWNPILFRLDPTGIRPMVDTGGKLVPDRVKPEALGSKKYRPKYYASWGDKIPGLAVFAGILPNWPRWLRVLVTVTFVAVIITIIFLIRR